MYNYEFKNQSIKFTICLYTSYYYKQQKIVTKTKKEDKISSFFIHI